MKNRLSKKVLSVLLAATLALSALSLAACGKQLASPENVAVASDGTITWSAVENASEYVLKINSEQVTTAETSYKAATDKDFRVTVVARAEGYKDSAPSKAAVFEASTAIIPPVITADVMIDGPRTVGGGLSADFKATVNVEGSDDRSVTWSVSGGTGIATIDSHGTLKTQPVDADKKITVRAAAVANPDCYAEVEVEVLAKTALTQTMLDALTGSKAAFDGYMEIKLYTMGLSSSLAGTVSYNVKTEMDGTNWHTVYENDLSGGESELFYRNIDGDAHIVGISYMNKEEFFPAQDEAGDIISWTDSGLYNSLRDLKLEDFEFVEEAWEWRYKAKSESDPFIERVVSSANPYDFDPVSLGLIISKGAIVGIHSVSADDYTVQAQHRAVKDLNVLLTLGDSVEVPALSTYKRDEEVHPALEKAIENTKKATNYTVTMRNTEYNAMYGGATRSGYKETVTADTVYFEPFTFEENPKDKENPYTYKSAGVPYGFKKISDSLYNAFTTSYEGEGASKVAKYEATRAYAEPFANAKPSFAFAAEIFRTYYPNPTTGETMYAVDSAMLGVASTFYKDLGNDSAMYGIFASDSVSGASGVTPRVFVKDGYITSAEFVYNIGGYMYGVVEIEYDYSAAALPEGVSVEFTPRQVPTSWNELVIREEADDEVGFNAYEYLRDKLFENPEFDPSAQIPFFGEVLGDSYGFGAAILRNVPLENGSSLYAPSVSFYYDVPLDANYTIDSSLAKVRKLLRDNGFELNDKGHWVKDGSSVVIDVEDNELDLYVHVRAAVAGERS